jgi:hypothetical protein
MGSHDRSTQLWSRWNVDMKNYRHRAKRIFESHIYIHYGLVSDSPIGHTCNLINDATIADYLVVLRRRLAFSDHQSATHRCSHMEVDL